MEKIASFTVNHLDLLPGLYVSRRDRIGSETVTTFDMRVTRPNTEPVIETAALHAIEHLGATFLRNDPDWKDKTIYDCVKNMCDFILAYEGTIPGASPRDCGNYLDLNLGMAKYYIARYRIEVLGDFTEARRVYPK